MSTLELEIEPRAIDVRVADDRFTVDLADGRSLIVPFAWYPRLLHATDSERRNWKLLGEGYGLEWPDLDEQIGMEGLMAGRRSGENESSFAAWLATRKES